MKIIIVFSLLFVRSSEAQVYKAIQDFVSGRQSQVLPPIILDSAAKEFFNSPKSSPQEFTTQAINYTKEQVENINSIYEHNITKVEVDFNIRNARETGVHYTAAFAVGIPGLIVPAVKAAENEFHLYFKDGIEAEHKAVIAIVGKGYYNDIEKLRIPNDIKTQAEQDKWLVKNGERFLTKEVYATLEDGAKSQAQKDAIHQVAHEALRDLIFKNKKDLDETLKKMTSKNEGAFKDLIRNKNKLVADMLDLGSQQEKLGKTFGALGDRIEHEQGNQRSELNAIEQVIYSKQSPKDQLRAIDEGTLHFDEKNKKEMISVLKTREFIEQDMTSAIETAGKIGQIAKNIGVSSDVTNAISTGISIGQGVQSILAGFALGGPMGYLNAAVTITSFFSGGGESAEDQRFKATMKMLTQMDKKLDKILENQETMYNALVILDKKIDRILTKLDEIDLHIEEMKKSQVPVVDYTIGFSDCNNIRRVRNVKDMREGGVSSYNQRLIIALNRLYPNKNKTGIDVIHDCLSSYLGIFGDGKFRNLYAGASDNKQTPAINLYNQTYNLLYDAFYAKASISTEKNPSFWNLFSLMVAPSSFIDVSKREVRLEELKAELKNRPLVTLDASQELLSVEAIEFYVGSLLENHLFWLLLQKNSSGQDILLSPVDIIRNPQKYSIGDGKKSSLDDLEAALKIVNTAVAQNSLFAGDYLLDLITQILTATTASNEALAKLRPSAVDLLRKNRILYQNWSQYFVIKRILADPDYGVSYAMGTRPEHLNREEVVTGLTPIPSGIDVSPMTDGGENFLALTLSEANANSRLLPRIELNLLPPKGEPNRLIYPSDMKKLIELKQKLLTAIASYTGFDGFTPQDFEVAKQIAFHTR